jgi:hypothetical protein
MDSTDETTSVLLLERPRPVAGSRPPTGEPAGEEVRPSIDLDDHLPHGETPALPTTSGSDFRGPLLGVLAAASILVGYRWLGVIPVSSSRLSNVVLGRGGALVFALLALWLAWSAARARGEAGEDRMSRPARLLVLAATVSTVVAAVLILRDIAVLRYTFGVSELLLASVAGTVLLVDERRRRRAGPNPPPVSPSRPGHHGAAAT